MPTNKKIVTRLDENLVLFRFMLHQFGMTSLNEFADIGMKNPNLEEYQDSNTSRYLDVILASLSLSDIFIQQLRQYDENIYRHTLRMNEKRETPVRWKYFQYLSLLFTEMYLDAYFENKTHLIDNLNRYLKNELRGKHQIQFPITDYKLDDINKLAIWQATGSGKTLLMHMHILMLNHYLKKWGKRNQYGSFILITPNEGLSAQHLAAFEQSNIPAEIFRDTSNMDDSLMVRLIDIYKFEEKKGVKTFAVEAFGNNNIVLIDEAHRGTSGEKWKLMRDTISKDGFAIEYSATFGQAIAPKVITPKIIALEANDRDKEYSLFEEYAKAILFDYSYRYFYDDGYGKEYRILNVEDNSIEENTETYLVATLLTYYQQLRIYLDLQQNRTATEFYLHKPLMVFVGAKVSKANKNMKQEVSDILRILLFIHEFIQHPQKMTAIIDNIMRKRSNLLDSNGVDIFENQFTYLRTSSSKAIYEDILEKIFHAFGSKELILDNLSDVTGEIGLKLGETSPYFGVINVGDANGLAKLCKEQGLNTRDKAIHTGSLFQKINAKDTPINILIGSKKFNEGWNSYRVSTMGLMNVGKSEGSQVIQLFGRGVRLYGYQNSLKRSSKVKTTIAIPEYFDKVETLNIFGVNAKYMGYFRDFLEKEGLSSTSIEEITIPVIVDEDKLSNPSNTGTKLKWFDLPEGIEFNEIVDSREINQYSLRPIELYLYAKLQANQSIESDGRHISQKVAHFEESHILLFNKMNILQELQRFKRENRWYNLLIDVDFLISRLLYRDWYKIYAPDDVFQIKSSDDSSLLNKVRVWEQDIAIPLLKKYLRAYYLHRKESFEKNKRFYRDLIVSDIRGMVSEYRFLIDKSYVNFNYIVKKLNDIQKKLSDKGLNGLPYTEDIENITLSAFSQHLYRPLVYVEDNKIKVVPTSLNKGEYSFVQGLEEYYPSFRKQYDTQFFLIRNQSRGRGLGFFEANNFYPDFVLWVLWKDKQYISFIDPKGIRNLDAGIQDPKIQFHKIIKGIGEKMGDDDVILNSFIITETSYDEVKSKVGSIEDCYQHNLLFMDTQNKSKVFDDLFNIMLRDTKS